MNLDSHASFDDLEMAVILPEEELDRARVFKLDSAWMVFGFFFQTCPASWNSLFAEQSPYQKTKCPPSTRASRGKQDSVWGLNHPHG
jgi:hypothetical protein